MMALRLEWIPVTEAPTLLALTVINRLKERLTLAQLAQAQVVEIDPAHADGETLCQRYGIDDKSAANCVLVTSKRGDAISHAACGIPPGERSDLNGVVRRQLAARRVSLMNKDLALRATGMEYGSITLVGLPTDWRVLMEGRLRHADALVMGSGLLKSKLRLPTHLLERVSEPIWVPSLSAPP